MLTVLDLFSGIGGFSLGLERTQGFKTVAFCEIDPFCRRVLAKHWPEVFIHDDVRTLRGADIGPVDVVCGGFPCQPFSTASAGKRKGQGDDRFLWPEMLRLIQEIRPTWVIGENVAGIEALALEQVVSDLETSGYEVAPPLEIPACAIGYDHRRSRYWFLAHTDSDGKPSRALNEEVAQLPRQHRIPGRVGTQNGLSSRMDGYRLKALGNAVVPKIPQMIGNAILACQATSTRVSA